MHMTFEWSSSMTITAKIQPYPMYKKNLLKSPFGVHQITTLAEGFEESLTRLIDN